MKRILRTALVVLLATKPFVAAGQTPQSPKLSPASPAPSKPVHAMTNADVVKMAKAGIGDELIVSAVEHAQRVAFDLSADGLIALKTGGVTDQVIRFLMDPKSKAAPKTDPPPTANPRGEAVMPPAATPALMNESEPRTRDAGIYLQSTESPQNVVSLEPTVFSQAKGNALGTMMTWGLAKTKWRAVVRSPRANIRTTEQQPVFYFYFENKTSGLSNTGGLGGFLAGASSPNEFVLVQMYEKRDSRELVVGESNVFSTSSGTRSEDTVPFRIERLGPGAYRVTPTEPLGTGEFCFFYSAGVTAPGASAVGKLFDFGVDSRRSSR